ncbi:lysophospholipase [Halopseudomonas sp.]|uniref:alpha/beta hydrolase n=1 Tax=Halopseudomonas sp. TaxID=2901191 RepID=UPI0035690264
MPCQTGWLAAEDQQKLFFYQWMPDAPQPRAWILISHGMAEHAGRYSWLAEQLNRAGYAVAALDQRGHGQSITDQPGHFADSDGWRKVTADISSLRRHISEHADKAPVFLLGHSMGSYIVQGHLLANAAGLAGVILSGSNAHPPAVSKAGRMAAGIEGRLRGWNKPALTLGKLSFGQFNKAFKPNRTEFDWLSRNPSQVDAYIEDPLCGFACTARLWHDLFGGLLQIADPDRLQQIRTDLPVHIVGGDADPVSAGNGLPRLQQRLINAGLTSTSLQLYDGARHEIFNEINREQVAKDLLDWLAKQLPATSSADSESADVTA